MDGMCGEMKFDEQKSYEVCILDKLVDKIRKKMERASLKEDMYREKHGPNPTENYNYYGGWSLGYWEGMLSVCEDILDALEKMK